MRSLGRRDEQMLWLGPVFAAQAACLLKAQQGPQAVTKKDKGLVQVRQQLLRYGAAERLLSSDMRFAESVAAPRQLNRYHTYHYCQEAR
jgi:hypothetical protein